MLHYDWQCLVCEASNPVNTDICQLCSAPVRLNGKEIELRRAQWESAEDVGSGRRNGLGLASKLAFFLVADIGLFFVFMSLATSGGGNAIGAGLIGMFLLIPAPFLAVAWIFVGVRSLVNGK